MDAVIGEGSGLTVALVVVLIGGILTFWWRIEGRFTEEREARAALARELSDYKLYSAQTHVSAAALRETEDRLIAAFDKLTARMEAIVGRLDKMSLDMATGSKPRG